MQIPQVFVDKLLTTAWIFSLYFIELSLLFLTISCCVALLQQRFQTLLQKTLKNNIFGYIKAILLGALTPFCSCSTIPLFYGLLQAKIPLSIACAYLLTSPLLNPVLLVMIVFTFGGKLASVYALFIILFVFFVALNLTKIPTHLLLKDNAIFSPKPTPLLLQKPQMQKPLIFVQKPKKISIKKAFNEALFQYKKVFVYLVVGMLIGAVLKGFAPQDSLYFIAEFKSTGIILAALLGIFLYVRVEAIIPIGVALLDVGVPLEIVMSFLIAGGGCSLPELILLKSKMRFLFLVIFVGIVLSSAIIFGYFTLFLTY
ncbi:permease [uncultured Helicobacter sp.]|uniref:permease n=1 Tax=uncultured Helicobacter sp. TaxID=175537 RepID=UPI00262CFDA0|nr:permease [uncultured Helicobacter sp.]